jgi:arylsulfatase A-like enzyme
LFFLLAAYKEQTKAKCRYDKTIDDHSFFTRLIFTFTFEKLMLSFFFDKNTGKFCHKMYFDYFTENFTSLMKIAGVGLLMVLLLFGCASENQTTDNSANSPNFVILFADDLGYGDLSSYGHPLIRTPNLDKMAEEGARFTSFYAGAPVCTPSRAALLTGRYAARIGLPNVLGPDSENGINPEEITLAEALKERGYQTQAVGKWHLGSTRPEHLPTSNGFDHYFGFLYSNDMKPPWVQTQRPLKLYRDQLEESEYPVDQRNLTVRYTREAVDFIDQAAGEPFFLYLAYSMPHLPVNVVDSMQGRSRAGLYGDVIQTIDWSVGEVLNSLKRNGVDENTLVVFTSDNGPWQNLPPRMLQEGIRPWHAGSAGHLRGSKATTWEGGVRVPAIFRWPGKVPEGMVTAEIASVLDLFPTIVPLAGGMVPDDRIYDGNDLYSLLQGETGEVGDKRFFYFAGKNIQAVRHNNWKLRIAGENAETELYDLELDHAEKYNRAEEFPELVQSLQNEMQQMQQEVDAGPGLVK